MTTPKAKRHGVRATYMSGCKCQACTRANTLYHRAYERGEIVTVDAEPIRAYLRALLDSGWSLTGIASRTGYSREGIRRILLRGKRVRETTAIDIQSLPLVAPSAAVA